MIRTATTCIALLSLLSACAQPRTVALAPASSGLLDRTAPVEVTETHLVAGRHGEVASGLQAGATAGALEGMKEAFGGSSEQLVQQVLGFAVMPVSLPLYVVGGAVKGAASAHSKEEADAAVGALEALYSDDDALGALDDRVAQRLEAAGFPAATGLAGGAAPENRLRLTQVYTFSTEGSTAPTLQFAVDVFGVAAGAGDGAGSQEFHWFYRSPKGDFFPWTEAGAKGLREQVTRAQAALAGRIVDDLVLMRRGETVSGTVVSADGGRFEPESVPVGVVLRLPTDAELNAPSAGS